MIHSHCWIGEKVAEKNWVKAGCTYSLATIWSDRGSEYRVKDGWRLENHTFKVKRDRWDKVNEF